MKLNNVLELLEEYKNILIITPDVHECKLLCDRFRLAKLNQIDKNLFELNGNVLKVIHAKALCSFDNMNYIIVEFPEACVKSLFKKLPVDGVCFCEEIR